MKTLMVFAVMQQWYRARTRRAAMSRNDPRNKPKGRAWIGYLPVYFGPGTRPVSRLPFKVCGECVEALVFGEAR